MEGIAITYLVGYSRLVRRRSTGSTGGGGNGELTPELPVEVVGEPASRCGRRHASGSSDMRRLAIQSISYSR